MLNISTHRINEKVVAKQYKSFQVLESRNVSRGLIIVMGVIIIGSILGMFLPWTQNIRSKGYVTTLSPQDRPQAVQSLIGGRIDQWYVQEDQLVAVGDTIIKISESKQDYLDPDILNNTDQQITAKSESSKAYQQKANNLQSQYDALANSRAIKLDQNLIKIEQTYLKIESDSLDLIAARTKLDIAKNQLVRIENLYNEGIKSLTDLEAKRLSLQESNAKVIGFQNKLNTHKNELRNLQANKIAIANEYDEKLAKAQSDRMSAVSSRYDADASKNKLQSQFNSYEERQRNYYITSPISGTISEGIKTGIGELIKQGEDIVTIVPSNYDLAVETYILPQDMPLLKVGQRVSVLFDGWPAIVFSGWPNSSYGTFTGKVFAMDNFIGKNGKYRVLIQQYANAEPWPKEVRAGGGANTITLLNNVSVGYELWRQLNGFPADYYNNGKAEDFKTKAPLKKVK